MTHRRTYAQLVFVGQLVRVYYELKNRQTNKQDKEAPFHMKLFAMELH